MNRDLLGAEDPQQPATPDGTADRLRKAMRDAIRELDRFKDIDEALRILRKELND